MAAEEIHKPPSLPPYPEMILAAIAALNEPNGSDESSILKYIESKYGVLPEGQTALLAHHLNVMKDSGEIVLCKNGYMKADLNAPPKRGRGRPPKPKDPSAQVPTPSTPARPRGRPPKDPNAPRNPVKPKAAGSGRKRGRPRKTAPPAGEMTGAAMDQTPAPATAPTMPMTAGSGRPRGRPPKVRTATVTEVSVQN